MLHRCVRLADCHAERHGYKFEMRQNAFVVCSWQAGEQMILTWIVSVQACQAYWRNRAKTGLDHAPRSFCFDGGNCTLICGGTFVGTGATVQGWWHETLPR